MDCHSVYIMQALNAMASLDPLSDMTPVSQLVDPCEYSSTSLMSTSSQLPPFSNVASNDCSESSYQFTCYSSHSSSSYPGAHNINCTSAFYSPLSSPCSYSNSDATTNANSTPPSPQPTPVKIEQQAPCDIPNIPHKPLDCEPCCTLDSLTLLSFNTGLLEYKICGLNIYQNPPFTRKRLMHIPAALRTCKADIVALQEVFDERHADFLIENLRNIYPFVGRRISGGILALHNGLMVLSKFQILHTKFHPFSTVTTLERLFGSKGMLEVCIDIPGIGAMTFFNIHMASGAVDPESDYVERLRGEEIAQLFEACDAAVYRGEIPIVIGDLNAAPELCASNYKLFLEHGWRDSWLLATSGYDPYCNNGFVCRSSTIGSSSNSSCTSNATSNVVPLEVEVKAAVPASQVVLGKPFVASFGGKLICVGDQSNTQCAMGFDVSHHQNEISVVLGSSPVSRQIHVQSDSNDNFRRNNNDGSDRNDNCNVINSYSLQQMNCSSFDGFYQKATTCKSSCFLVGESCSCSDTHYENVTNTFDCVAVTNESCRNPETYYSTIPTEGYYSSSFLGSKMPPVGSAGNGLWDEDCCISNYDKDNPGCKPDTMINMSVFSSGNNCLGINGTNRKKEKHEYFVNKKWVHDNVQSQADGTGISCLGDLPKNILPKGALSPSTSTTSEHFEDAESLLLINAGLNCNSANYNLRCDNSEINENDGIISKKEENKGLCLTNRVNDLICMVSKGSSPGSTRDDARNQHEFTWDPLNPLNSIGPHSGCHGLRCDYIFLPPSRFSSSFVNFLPAKADILFRDPRVIVDACCFGYLGRVMLVTLSDHYALRVELKRIKDNSMKNYNHEEKCQHDTVIDFGSSYKNGCNTGNYSHLNNHDYLLDCRHSDKVLKNKGSIPVSKACTSVAIQNLC